MKKFKKPLYIPYASYKVLSGGPGNKMYVTLFRKGLKKREKFMQWPMVNMFTITMSVN